ncbi:50S ribosomal protein L29 [Candidatus Woesearchaeota archaeon]|nr:50S ribosomal protein L29 [Candidatus Woesearchaeota archaeon]
MRKKEIQTMQPEEMKAKLVELRKEMMKINSQIATGTVPKSPGQMRQIKRTIARILTIRREKQGS